MVLQRQDQSRNLSGEGAARFMKRHSRDAEANKTTSMKVQYDGNLGVRRNNPRLVDPEEGAGCRVERHVFRKSHGSVGGGGFIGGGYEGGQATAGERAVWVRDEAEGFVGVGRGIDGWDKGMRKQLIPEFSD